MQEYASTSQTPPPRVLVTIPSHFLNLPPQNPPRLLVTIPSHFLNLPPKTLHARVFLNFTASPLQDFLLDAKSFSKPPPQKNPTCKSIPLFKTSCHDSKSFSKPPPQNPTCKSMSQLHSPTYPSLLVTSPSHFLNLPPQNHTCKSMSQLHSFTSPSLLVTSPSHFLNLPPQNHTCKSMPQIHRLPPPRVLVTRSTSPKKKKHADSCGFIRD